MTKAATRENAMEYVLYAVDDTLAERRPSEMPPIARLVGWQIGFEPVFVAVWSAYGWEIDDEDAVAFATDLLVEKKWWGEGIPTEPNYIL